MKTMIRKVTTAVKAGDKTEASKLIAGAYKAIDMASKKHIIHPKNAARKKSGIAKMVGAMK
jgi:small subunit ribosomal protein S20